MGALELVVVLGMAVLAGQLVAIRLQVASPLVLLCIGIVLGFIPGLRQVSLPPEVMLFLFLPVLLYWESVTTSLREIRRNLRGIVAMSTVLVFATAAVVAVVAHSLGMPWGPAWVLGAAAAPTDATAVGVLARALPRRNVTILRAESLINDGTALVIYGLALGAIVGSEHLSTTHVTALLLLSYGGGLAAGFFIAWVGILVRKRLTDPLLHNVAILLIPFTAYLLAELVEASGVLAVVVCGLTMSQASPRLGQPGQRRQTQASWELATFLLNGALFVLVGLELQLATRDLPSVDLVGALVLTGVVSVAVIAVRFVFIFGGSYLTYLLDRRSDPNRATPPNREQVVSCLAGFRGAVSLAVALSVPTMLATHQPFPNRDLIIFVTAGLILVTLLQALALPKVLRWTRLGGDTSVADERRFAEATALQEALDALAEIAADLSINPKLADQVRTDYEKHRQAWTQNPSVLPPHEQLTQLRLALLAHKRATIIRLRDEGHIDDTVLRAIQTTLDIEEIRLAHQPHTKG